jgi:hypothetical protein
MSLVQGIGDFCVWLRTATDVSHNITACNVGAVGNAAKLQGQETCREGT